MKESNASQTDKLPLGTKVLLNLLSNVQDPKCHHVNFDNFFISQGAKSERNAVQIEWKNMRDCRKKYPKMDDKKMNKKRDDFTVNFKKQ